MPATRRRDAAGLEVAFEANRSPKNFLKAMDEEDEEAEDDKEEVEDDEEEVEDGKEEDEVQDDKVILVSGTEMVPYNGSE